MSKIIPGTLSLRINRKRKGDKAVTRDEKLMERCLELAKKGSGYVSPNPMAGCVIVKGGKVIAEGYHKAFGKSHAEVNAILNAKSKGFDVKGAELYVNLEPCVHYGKTPPCTNEIIRSKIKKVVIGTKDPNPLVSGKGIRKLRENGVDVTEGILRDRCKGLNKFFFKFIKTGLPYVTLKAAVTLDGKIADEKHRSKWISSFESRKLVHKLRSEYDAVLIGRNTLEYDNPALTVRHVSGRNPHRILIDKDLKSGLDKKIFKDKYRNKTIVLTSSNSKKKRLKDLNRRGIKTVMCRTNDRGINLKDALRKLGKIGIASILVEGGAETYSGFLDEGLADELIIFIAPKIMGKGVDVFNSNKKFDFSKPRDVKVEVFGRDVVINILLK